MIPGVETASPFWRALRKHLDARLDRTRDELEAPQAEDLTAFRRGYAAALREIIRDGESRPVPSRESGGSPY